MAHGTPDWGLVGPKNITYGLDDLGEHAVRLGSPDLWDRRGDVVYVSYFREGLGSMLYGAFGAGGRVDLVVGYSRQGAYCLRLRAGSDAGREATVQLVLPLQDPSAVGLEFSFSVDDWTSEVRDEISWWDGARGHTASVAYDHPGQRLMYYTAGAVWDELQAGVLLYPFPRCQHTMKLVVDMGAGDYVRFLVDDQAYDMRGWEVHSAPMAMAGYWQFAVRHYAVAGHNPDCYVDSVIVTQNEPR